MCSHDDDTADAIERGEHWEATMRDDATPPTICESCGCEVYPAGHPGNMCRTIVALRAERDRLAAELARVRDLIEGDPCDCEGEPLGSDYYCERCSYLTPNDTKGEQ
jgi:hypothetical protein